MAFLGENNMNKMLQNPSYAVSVMQSAERHKSIDD